jgi:iron complex outermembrane receptor protein
MQTPKRWAARAAAAASLCCTALSQAQPAQLALADLSIEELGNILVSSVSRRSESLADAPAAIYVITATQIRRSGATSLPEALRLAPNLQVARVNGSSYAISARGFNSQSANKLLVLIDGRSVYTPLFSGVFWDVQDLMLEDIERIEVISGPGGTLWGVNAVNGIINVVTKTAHATPGGLLTVSAGDQNADAGLRYGGRLAEGASYRLYAKGFRHGHTWTDAGVALEDRQHAVRAGGRFDWTRGQDKLALIANAYDGNREQPIPGSIAIAGTRFALGDIPTSGVNIVGRFERTLDDGASLVVQGTWDRTRRTVTPTFAEHLDILDLQVLHAWMPWSTHRLVWGAEARASRDRVSNSEYIAFLPARVDQNWTSVFAQDEIALQPTLKLTLGARMEHNDYTGADWLPSIRLGWNPRQDQLVWGALSRAIRAPSRLDVDTFVPGRPPFLLLGGPQVRSEIATVAELGYRGRLGEGHSLSVSAFHADYDRLRTQQVAPSGRSVTFESGMEGTVQGLEAWSAHQLSPSWRLQLGAVRLWQQFRLRPGSNDLAAPLNAEGTNPSHQWLLQSSWNLGDQVDVDLAVRHVARLPRPAVPAYTAADLRVAWRASPDLELSLVVRNLQGGGHGEFSPEATRSELDRSAVLKASLRF